MTHWKEEMFYPSACDNVLMHASKSEEYVSAFLCFNLHALAQ